MATRVNPEAPPVLPKRPTFSRRPVPWAEGAREKKGDLVLAKQDESSRVDTELEPEPEDYDLKIGELKLDDEAFADDFAGSPAQLSPASTSLSGLQSPISPGESKWKTAYAATKHFAGGLVSHPVESTKHYSVLRHSHGLVLYKGASTNVAVTIFADSAPPLGRTIWLQQKGWTGSRGMRLKTAMGRNDSWLEVTPQARVDSSQVNAPDEKAWQRDITRFLRKAAADKKFQKRRVAETCIVRIPFASQDGYFRLVVCADEGKRVLCPSPVFRVASFGTDSASFKGASLRTLPLEVGVMALTTFATDAATAGMAPIAGAIQNRFGQYVPGAVTRKAATKAYGASGLQGKVASANELHGQTRRTEFEGAGDEERIVVVVGDDSGPSDPYPVRFSGKVVQGEGRSNVDTGLPSANLSGVRAEVKSGLDGVYFGWAAVRDSDTIVSDEWRQALVFARPAAGAPGLVPKRKIQVYILEDFAGVEFFGATLSVIVMGFLRPWSEYDPDRFAEDTLLDMGVARQSLARQSWGAELTLKQARANTSLTDRYVNVRQFGQRQFDRIPFDRLAVRMGGAELRDGALGKGGLFIDRTGAEAVGAQ